MKRIRKYKIFLMCITTWQITTAMEHSFPTPYGQIPCSITVTLVPDRNGNITIPEGSLLHVTQSTVISVHSTPRVNPQQTFYPTPQGHTPQAIPSPKDRAFMQQQHYLMANGMRPMLPNPHFYQPHQQPPFFPPVTFGPSAYQPMHQQQISYQQQQLHTPPHTTQHHIQTPGQNHQQTTIQQPKIQPTVAFARQAVHHTQRETLFKEATVPIVNNSFTIANHTFDLTRSCFSTKSDYQDQRTTDDTTQLGHLFAQEPQVFFLAPLGNGQTILRPAVTLSPDRLTSITFAVLSRHGNTIRITPFTQAENDSYFQKIKAIQTPYLQRTTKDLPILPEGILSRIANPEEASHEKNKSQQPETVTVVAQTVAGSTIIPADNTSHSTAGDTATETSSQPEPVNTPPMVAAAVAATNSTEEGPVVKEQQSNTTQTINAPTAHQPEIPEHKLTQEERKQRNQKKKERQEEEKKAKEKERLKQQQETQLKQENQKKEAEKQKAQLLAQEQKKKKQEELRQQKEREEQELAEKQRAEGEKKRQARAQEHARRSQKNSEGKQESHIEIGSELSEITKLRKLINNLANYQDKKKARKELTSYLNGNYKALCEIIHDKLLPQDMCGTLAEYLRDSSETIKTAYQNAGLNIISEQSRQETLRTMVKTAGQRKAELSLHEGLYSMIGERIIRATAASLSCNQLQPPHTKYINAAGTVLALHEFFEQQDEGTGAKEFTLNYFAQKGPLSTVNGLGDIVHQSIIYPTDFIDKFIFLCEQYNQRITPPRDNDPLNPPNAIYQKNDRLIRSLAEESSESQTLLCNVRLAVQNKKNENWTHQDVENFMALIKFESFAFAGVFTNLFTQAFSNNTEQFLQEAQQRPFSIAYLLIISNSRLTLSDQKKERIKETFGDQLSNLILTEEPFSTLKLYCYIVKQFPRLPLYIQHLATTLALQDVTLTTIEEKNFVKEALRACQQEQNAVRQNQMFTEDFKDVGNKLESGLGEGFIKELDDME